MEMKRFTRELSAMLARMERSVRLSGERCVSFSRVRRTSIPSRKRRRLRRRATSKTAAERILYDIVAQANQRFSQRLAETLGRHLSQATGSPYRGSFPGDFFVLRYAKVPAVLVEIGFGDHPVEGRNLADPDYREKVAQGLLAGILTFLGNGAFAR